MRRLVTTTLVAVMATVGLTASPAQAVPERCALAAHRGDWSGGATENGLPAVRSAIAGGADYVEVDVTLTRDEHFVIMHDPTLKRTTNGTGLVTEKTLSYVRSLRLNDGSRVPRLSDVLTVLAPSDLHVILHIKQMGDLSTFRDMKRQVNGFGSARIRFITHRISWLDRLRSIAPGIPQAVMTRELLTPQQVSRFGAVMIRFDRMTSGWLEGMPYPVYSFTPNRVEDWSSIQAELLTAVLTDVPWEFMAWRETGCPS